MQTKVLRKILQILLDNMEEGVHIVDENGLTLAYNKAMEDIEGLNPQEVLGKPISDLFPRMSVNNSTLLQALEHGRIVENHQQDYTNLKGRKISALNTTFPVIVEGKVRGAIELSSNVSDVRELSMELNKLQSAELGEDLPNYYTFDSIVGSSMLMKKVVDLAKKCAQTEATVLIVGDTGTGKELIAQSIHNGSKRSKRPFVAINCASLTESLLESLLFGTVKGAYTGAVDTKGLFEQAHTGTLFLDEINSMSLNLQTKILRVLQEGFVRRVGGTKDTKVDVRIIAATNSSPMIQVEAGTLRRDLYYRLNVMRVDLPSLNEREGDIEELAFHFLDYYSEKLGKSIEGIDSELLKRLKLKTYRGNVRELQHLIESAVSLKEDDGPLEIKDMPNHFFIEIEDRLVSLYNEDVSLIEYLERIEKNVILAAFGKENANISRTAKRLKIPRQNLQYKLKKYSILESEKAH
ncbi:sigma-54 interaction domain-containing protein [Guggenheimella bovis]